MALLWVAPTEPAKLREAIVALGGTVSMTPERFGVDVMWMAKGVRHGIQRKEISDFLNSVTDGRLAKEFGQMAQIAGTRILLLEGNVQFGADDQLMNQRFGRPWTRQQWQSYMLTVQTKHGVMVAEAKTLQQTIAYIDVVRAWTLKEKHTSTLGRPAAVSVWGKPDNREYGIHLLQGLPAVGPDLAERIWEKFGGVPWRWDITVDQLTAIKGIGKGKADAIYRAIRAR